MIAELGEINAEQWNTASEIPLVGVELEHASNKESVKCFYGKTDQFEIPYGLVPGSIALVVKDNEQLNTHDIADFLTHILERMDFSRDLHFYTQTTIHTLDYSGEGLNSGCKVVFAAAGPVKRKLMNELSKSFKLDGNLTGYHIAMPGVLTVQGNAYTNDHRTDMEDLKKIVTGSGYQWDCAGCIL